MTCPTGCKTLADSKLIHSRISHKNQGIILQKDVPQDGILEESIP